MGVSFIGMYVCIVDIIPNGSDICSTADIPKLAAIPIGEVKDE